MAGKKKRQKSHAADSGMDDLQRKMAELNTGGGGKTQGKPKQTKAQKKRAQKNAAVLEHFAKKYSEDKLESWQAVSADIGVEIGSSVAQCKKILKGVFMNIHDFVAAQKQGQLPHRFGSRKQLADYIRNTGKYFPIEEARGVPVLEWMLIYVR